MITQFVIKDVVELARLESEWNDLLNRSYTNTFFQRFEWLYYWAKYFISSDDEMIILIFRHNNLLVGIAPLFIANRQIRFLGDPLSDYNDFIIDRKYKNDILMLILQHMKKLSQWDKIHLMEIPKESFTLDYFRSNHPNFIISKIADSHNFKAKGSIDSNLEEFALLASGVLSKRERLRRFMKSSKCSFVRASTRNEFDEFLNKLKEFHIQRWCKTSTPSYFTKEIYNSFFDELYLKLFENKSIEVSVVKSENEIIAAEICYVHDKKGYSYTTTYNAKYSNISPGNAHTIFLVNYFLSLGFREFDFTRGDQDYKLQFTNSTSANYEVEIYKNIILAGLNHSKKFFIRHVRSSRKIYKLIMGYRGKIKYRLRMASEKHHEKVKS
jgi:CelD/BcsL family acetyltransferase involved in cellulose biosynthesis